MKCKSFLNYKMFCFYVPLFSYFCFDLTQYWCVYKELAITFQFSVFIFKIIYHVFCCVSTGCHVTNTATITVQYAFIKSRVDKPRIKKKKTEKKSQTDKYTTSLLTWHHWLMKAVAICKIDYICTILTTLST